MASNDDVDTGSYAAAGSDWAADENFYGHDTGRQHRGRQWKDVEPEVRSGWQKFEAKGESAWESVKGAVRDAWDRVTGH